MLSSGGKTISDERSKDELKGTGDIAQKQFERACRSLKSRLNQAWREEVKKCRQTIKTLYKAEEHQR